MSTFAPVLLLALIAGADAFIDADKKAHSYTFNDAIVKMPEWPKLVMFLPADTPKDAPEFRWHHQLQKEFGNSMLVMSVVNATSGDSGIMEIFKLTRPDELPAVKVIKPGSVDLAKGQLEAYEVQSSLPWGYKMLKSLGQKTKLKAKTTIKQVDIPRLQVTRQNDFVQKCVAIGHGRCVIFFVDMNKDQPSQLKIMEEALTGFFSVFYEFRPMWADISLRKSVFNMPQLKPDTPQVVILDVKEKLFAPKEVKDASQMLKVMRAFDQPQAMKKMKEAKGKTPIAVDSALPDIGDGSATHTEL